MLARCGLVLLMLSGLECLDYGRDGVWDSPMATDYWVKRFGFMWAGGRSGMKGMEALQKTADLTYSNEIPTSVYNPSGMYGLKAMGSSVPEYPQLVTPRPILSRRLALPVVKEKKMTGNDRDDVYRDRVKAMGAVQEVNMMSRLELTTLALCIEVLRI